MGYELCHILQDRFFGGEISVVSGPWAPASLEKRANAFAAMLLMPPTLINDKIATLTVPLATPEGITQLVKAVRVGRRALLWHLYNLNKLDEEQRIRLEQDGKS